MSSAKTPLCYVIIVDKNDNFRWKDKKTRFLVKDQCDDSLSSFPLLQFRPEKDFEEEKHNFQLRNPSTTSRSRPVMFCNNSVAFKKDDISDHQKGFCPPILVKAKSQSGANGKEEKLNSPYRTKIANFSQNACTCACKNVPLSQVPSENMHQRFDLHRRPSSVVDRVTCMIDCEKCGSDVRGSSDSHASNTPVNYRQNYHHLPSTERYAFETIY